MKRMKYLQLPVALILVMILAVSFSCNNPTPTVAGLYLDTLNMADAKMKAYVDDGKLPCVSTMIIRDGKIVHRAVMGYYNIDEQRALGEDAIFRIYSMSKPITTAALMMLYDEGKFQLDDPVLKQIRDQIAGLDINNLTPMEALNKLNEIKKLSGL